MMGALSSTQSAFLSKRRTKLLASQANQDQNKHKPNPIYKRVKSPTKKLIEQFEDRIHEFDINRVLEWNSENIRKYKIFIERFENSAVLLNIMLLDKQIQDLQHNYKLIRTIRDKERDFNKLSEFLKDNFNIINKQFKTFEKK